MSEAKFSKGPWHRNIKPARKYNMVFAGRNTHVAAIQSRAGMTDEEIEANCDLITAAPEMFDLVRLFRKTVAYYIDLDQRAGDDEAAKLKQFTLAQIDAALAKAEGRSP